MSSILRTFFIISLVFISRSAFCSSIEEEAPPSFELNYWASSDEYANEYFLPTRARYHNENHPSPEERERWRESLRAWMKAVHILGKEQNDKDADSIFCRLLGIAYYNSIEENPFCKIMKEAGVFERCDGILPLLDFCCGYTDYLKDQNGKLVSLDESKLLGALLWANDKGIWAKCQSTEECLNVYKVLMLLLDGRQNESSSDETSEESFSDDSVQPETYEGTYQWLSHHGLWETLEDGEQISAAFALFNNYPQQEREEDYEWMQASGVWALCENTVEKFDVFSGIKAFIPTGRIFCHNKPEDRGWICNWLQESGALKKSKNGSDVATMLHTLQREYDYRRDVRMALCTWVSASGELDRCDTSDQILALLNTFRYSIYDYMENIKADPVGNFIQSWTCMKLISRTDDPKELKAFLDIFRGLSPPKRLELTEYLRDTEMLDEWTYFPHVKMFVSLVAGYHSGERLQLMNWLQNTGVWDKLKSGMDSMTLIHQIEGLPEEWRKILYGWQPSEEQLESLNKELGFCFFINKCPLPQSSQS